MPGVLHVRALNWNLQGFELGKRSTIPLRNFRAPGMELRKLAQLVQADGRLKVSHVVLEARVNHFVVPGAFGTVSLPGVSIHAVQAPSTRFIDDVWWAGQHATFGRGHVFRGVEGKAREQGDIS